MKSIIITRRLVNVRLHMMFRPALIYIIDLTVFGLTFLQRDNQKKKIEFKKIIKQPN